MADAEIFLSWSQPTSHQIAVYLKKWIPKVIPGTDPWVSTVDVRKGKAWFAEISGQLTQSNVCLICVTPENVQSPWLYYEAGVIANALPNALVCPLLIGVPIGALRDTPLGQFQCTIAERDDVLRLLESICEEMCVKPEPKLIKANFQTRWPKLEAQFGEVLKSEREGSQELEMDQTELMPVAKDILVATSQDSNGRVMMSKTLSGFAVTTNGDCLCDQKDPKVEAMMKAAIHQLVDFGFLESVGSSGSVFAITHSGYEMAEEIEAEIRASRPLPDFDDNDVLAMLKGWFNNKKEVTQPMFYAHVDEEVRMPPGSAERFLEQVARDCGYVIEHKGKNVIKFKQISSRAPGVSNPNPSPWLT